MGIMARAAGTVAVLGAWGFFSGLGQTIEPLVQGQFAAKQLQDSDWSYITSQYGMHSFGPVVQWGVAVVAIVLLFLIWKGQFKRAAAGAGAGAFLAAMLLGGGPAGAYYSQSNYPEWVNILPNESAFLIPLLGDNKSSQAQFQSAEYLKQNKVAAKRVEIPHYQLPKSSWTKDYWVPSAQLILVDRSPYQREWTADPDKGTSSKNQAFRCESKDSHRIDTAVTIAAYVTEEDASAFLYHFGVNPPKGERTDENVIFASTVFGRSLEQVMDTNVRGKVHAVLCAELARWALNDPDQTKRLFDHKADIITAVEKQVRELYKPMGISIEYLGFADELSYLKEIQDAINRVFIAQKEKEAAVALQEALPVLQAEADIEIKKGLAVALKTGLAKGLEKGLPTLPNFVGDLGAITGWGKEMLGSIAQGPQPAAATARAKTQ